MTQLNSELKILDLGCIDYQECLEIQKEMVKNRINSKIPDSLLIVSHHPVVTIGKSGDLNELIASQEELTSKKIQVCLTDRGGKSTFHGPGQLIIYPIIKLREKDVHWYVQSLLNVVSALLIDLNLKPELRQGTPGVWVNNRKIASIGIALKKWVAYHGIALNVNTDVSWFNLINPCGVPGQPVTSIKDELGTTQDISFIKETFVSHLKNVFGYSKLENSRHPDWLKIPVNSNPLVRSSYKAHLFHV